jgi:hypothetical protein
MSVNLSLFAGAGWQFFDNAGNILSGGKIYSYAAGTTTPQVTYTTSAGNIQHSNPIILNAYGRISDEIWLTEGLTYKFVLADANNATIGTYDNILGANDVTAAIAGVYANFANTSDVAKGDALVGFKQSNSSGVLTGAIGRTVHQKFQEMISVKDFGATGDGVTDDSGALQAAITAAGAQNATLYIPDGTYYYTSLLVISSPMTITGDGYGSQLKPNTPSGNNIRINASNVLIEKIRMEGTSPGGFAVGYSGVVTNVTFQNCFFKDVGQCVWIWTARDVTVQNCVFDTTGYGVIQQYGYVSSFVLVDNCIARNMKADFVEANCGSPAPSESWTITNNIYEGAQNFPSSATEQRFVGITSVKNVIISGNNVQKANGDAPIHLEDSLGETIISNNIIDNCLNTGGNFGYIYLLNNAENVLIEGNMFFRTNASLPAAYAIDVSSASYSNSIQFIGNRVVGGGASGNFSFMNAGFHNGITSISNNMFVSLNEVISINNTQNLLFSGNYINLCNNGLLFAASPTGGDLQNFTVVGNTFLNTVGTNDIRATTNTNGTLPPSNWMVNGNVFSKEVRIGDSGAAAPNQATNLTITNNVFNSTATLAISGSPSNLVRFGNVFQAAGITASPTAEGLGNYANDAAAAAANIQVGGLYRNGSVVQVRVV